MRKAEAEKTIIRVWVPAKIKKALSDIAGTNRRTMSAELLLAIESHLTKTVGKITGK